jgi:hypothetical protein
MSVPIFVYKYNTFQDVEVIGNWLEKNMAQDGQVFAHLGIGFGLDKSNYCSFRFERENLDWEVEVNTGEFFVAIMNKDGTLDCVSSKECPYYHSCQKEEIVES